ncbi:GTP cyclohydrolase I type 1 [Candidatus Kuenenia stuttgartiensis]|jgi:GTP cyclohydrolase I|uniref:GTP cyclohydrolase I n=1 Tax=Kuenenia stuttgartiensis TaxID=174633 RepID=Q1Q0A8_KUEST|nr:MULTISPECIES: GTP cyclohydrolase I [Kuenenia]MBE7546488.1 GTP cyclohydrolase I [Planctomycetia bacterium]MCF6151049.1 GTP cyclohydrolase I [Candidatus Kuenenia stuttgartiensis]MCL4728310.1 GTP cyclohydrolase I [Candidatus Kuenenia stuttgartiensis]MCZ7623500.1 GTP cyclohydrolase I [Candidatus Kuenenia sp.]QII09849.1 GTP cyclohydrolase I type 1 [Candidatus Kuenenia stuttgartiensis]
MNENVIANENNFLKVKKRQISDEQIRKFEGYAAEIFTTLGLNLNTAATKETPHRFINALIESTEGYDGDPKLVKVFETECRGGPDCRLSQIIEGPIRFFALCEHHCLPFYGVVYVGYISHEHIIGLSKLTRLVHLFSRRFEVQERIGQQIADTLNQLLLPHGVAVYIEAHHLCVEMRGVKEISSISRTTFWRGNYDGDPALRAEFLAACGKK